VELEVTGEGEEEEVAGVAVGFDGGGEPKNRGQTGRSLLGSGVAVTDVSTSFADA